MMGLILTPSDHRERQSGFVSSFFTYGNTLPIQRLTHSKYGGLFQPTVTQVIRLLSDPHSQSLPEQQSVQLPHRDSLPSSLPPSDPFSASELTYTTNGLDSFPAPSAYPSRRFSWIHIFPEGMIHQHPQKVMRYFKWGVARLILEAEPCPDVLPMWFDGPQEVMNEKRTWPRPVPRPGKQIFLAFGELMDRDAVLEPFRARWRLLKEKSRNKRASMFLDQAELLPEHMGELEDDDLKYGPEAEQLRIEVTLAVRNEVLKVRRSRGLPDEDRKRGLADTYRKESKKPGQHEGEMKDQSLIKDA